jgi:riboflavin synthase
VSLPSELHRLVAMKGSVTVDGVSLTVAGLGADRFEIAYIPHTLAVTGAGDHRPGTRVNLEVDLLARYLARMLETSGEVR